MDDRAVQLWRSRKRVRDRRSGGGGDQRSGCEGVGGDYDVFLNHRGPDVKSGFVAHLDEALRGAGLNPFLDKASLRKGHPAFASIERALEGAKVHVAVVSKGYAESKYCLTELVTIMGSRKPVVPVFYDVDPSEVRWVDSGPFAAAFEKHKTKRTAEQVEECKDALGRLADLTGLCFRSCEYKGDETELKWEVVDAILHLIPRMEVLQVDRHLVGMEARMKMCVRKLEMMSSSGTCLLGLVGMGGVGKTCLAKQIYNYFVAVDKMRFESTSFLEVDRESPPRVEVGWGMMSKLQEQLLWDVLGVSESNPRMWKSWFHKLGGKGPVLVVVDGVHMKSQFDEVILDVRLLPPRSCIIVTSRDQHLLEVIGHELELYVHEVKPLGNDDSQRLFNLHVFGDEEAPEKFKAVANEVSKGCGGLGLALKLVGSSLIGRWCDEDLESIWPEAIEALKEDDGLISALRWSYDCLSEREKMMFVDIACVFHGWKKEEALEIWKSCKGCASCCGFGAAHTTLKGLIDKSLVVLEDDYGYKILCMHGMLRDLGKSIGVQNGSHLWKGNVGKVVEDKRQGLKKVRALNLSSSINEKYDMENFTMMTNLHYLTLDGCNIDGDFGSTFRELRTLQCRYMPLTYVPMMQNLSKLVSLDFSKSTKLARIWAESSLEGFPHLLNLNLTGCTSLTSLPDSMHSLSRLLELKIKGCKNLKRLPDSVGQLTGLQRLDLGSCASLEALPDSITSLSQLQWLALPFCSSISKLPTSFGLMIGLAEVHMDLCIEGQAVVVGQLNVVKKLLLYSCTDEAITALDSLGALRNLHQLSLLWFKNCPSMTKLPKTIGLLTNLDKLLIQNCEKLQKLPNSIRQLKLLTELFVLECSSLEALPDSLGALTYLRKLVIVGCKSLKNLPPSIGLLSNLRLLSIEGCDALQSLPKGVSQLDALIRFEILECGSLEGVGVVRVLDGLRIWRTCTSITSELPGSCLMVVDSEFVDPDEYEYSDSNMSVQFVNRNLSEVQVVEVDACGYLRLVQDSESGRLMWQCVHTLPDFSSTS